MSRTLLVGLLGAGFVVILLMLASPADLFGRVPALTGHLAAPSEDVAVVDGQTLRLRGTVLRLMGVAVPPRGQVCQGGGGSAYDCGAAASQKLAALIRGHDVICQYDGRNQAGVLQAQCNAGDTDLNRAMTDETTRQ